VRETSRYSALAEERAQSAATQTGRPPVPASPFHIFSTPYRRRVLQLAAIWLLTFFCTQSAMLFWKEFAVAERGMSAPQVGACLTIAALLAMPLVFAVGKLLDVIGRRLGATLVFGVTIVAVVGAYTLHSTTALTLALLFGIAGTTAMLSVLHTYTTELFPTALRSDAYGWSNNLIGRSAAVISPGCVGLLAERIGFGGAVSLTVLGPLLALGLILVLLPETRGRELEDTAVLGL
jgi:putative MFS transporter